MIGCNRFGATAANPHEPGRRKANVTDLARLGKAILHLIAKAVDDQGNLRMAAGVPRDWRFHRLRSLTGSHRVRRDGQ